MRIISLSADGLREAAGRGFYDWLSDQEADFVCIQDIRCSEYDLTDSAFFPPEYNAYFFDDVESGQNGVAIYTRRLPKAIMTGLGFPEFDMQGRYIQADFESISVGSLLVPQAREDDPVSLASKSRFLDLLLAHLQKVSRKRRQFIICGNWQMAHTPADLQGSERHAGSIGFTAGERSWLDELYSSGYVDAFREINSDGDEFTWWPGGDRNTDGWRSDFQVVSESLKYKVEYGAIYKKREFSTHAPIIMDYDLEL